MNEEIQGISGGDRVVMWTDINGHVNEGNTDEEDVMEKFSLETGM